MTIGHEMHGEKPISFVCGKTEMLLYRKHNQKYSGEDEEDD